MGKIKLYCGLCKRTVTIFFRRKCLIVRYRSPVKWIYLLFTRTFLGCLLRALKVNRKSFLCCFFFQRGFYENFQIFIRSHQPKLNYCNSHLESLLHSLMWILSWIENFIAIPSLENQLYSSWKENTRGETDQVSSGCTTTKQHRPTSAYC